jgi:chromosomal replication initiator protein
MDEPGKQIWSVVAEAFGRLRGGQVRRLWLEDAEPRSFCRGLFTLDVSDAAKKEAIDSCYRKDLESIFQDITGSPVRLRTRVASPVDGDTRTEAAAGSDGDAPGNGTASAAWRATDGRPAARRAPKTPRPEASPSVRKGRAPDPVALTGPVGFESTPANELAFRAVCKLADQADDGFNPLFIYGPPGSGKTALARFALTRFQEQSDSTDPLVLSGDALSRDVRRASRTRTFGALQSQWSGHDTILLDEAHRLRGQHVAQTVAVSLIGPTLERGGRVLVLSRHAPGEIHRISDRLRSHFEGGLVVALRQPDQSDREAVLFRVAASLPTVVDEDAIRAVAERCPGTLTEAVELLHRAAVDVRREARAIRLADVDGRLVAGGQGPKSMDLLVRMLCAETGLSPERLRSSEKSRDVASIRHLCVYFASRSLGLSARQICRSLRLRSPSIVAYSRRAVERKRTTDPSYEKLIHVLQARLAGVQRDFEW